MSILRNINLDSLLVVIFNLLKKDICGDSRNLNFSRYYSYFRGIRLRNTIFRCYKRLYERRISKPNSILVTFWI